MKIQKQKYIFFFFWGGGPGGGRGSGWWGGGEVRVCERRIEFFCENSKKKNWGESGGGVGLVGGQGDVNEELKFL